MASEKIEFTNAEKETLLKALNLYTEKVEKLSDSATDLGMPQTAAAANKEKAQVEALKNKIL